MNIHIRDLEVKTRVAQKMVNEVKFSYKTKLIDATKEFSDLKSQINFLRFKNAQLIDQIEGAKKSPDKILSECQKISLNLTILGNNLEKAAKNNQ